MGAFPGVECPRVAYESENIIFLHDFGVFFMSGFIGWIDILGIYRGKYSNLHLANLSLIAQKILELEHVKGRTHYLLFCGTHSLS